MSSRKSPKINPPAGIVLRMTPTRPIPPEYRIPLQKPGELIRTQVLEKMAAARDAKCLVLAAGSGFGKSTVLAQYARMHREHEAFAAIAWLSLREDVSDPWVFLAMLQDALTWCRPQALCEPLETKLFTVRQAVVELARTLNLQQQNLLILLDNGQHLSGTSKECLELLITSLAEGHQLCLATYDTTSFPALASLVARGECVVIDNQWLKFSDAEAATCLEASTAHSSPDAPLLNRLQGWPIVIGLLCAGIGAQLHPSLLIEHVLQRLPPGWRGMLEMLALHDYWATSTPAQLALALPPDWIQTLCSLGLPITSLGHDQVQPHLLLTDVLKDGLRCDPERLKQVALVAARQAEADRADHTAMRHYLTANCLDDALRLATKLTAQSQRQREHQVTLEILQHFKQDQLPSALLEHLGSALYECGRNPESLAVLEDLRRRHLLAPEQWGALISAYLRAGRSDEAWALLDDALARPLPELAWIELSRQRAMLMINLSRYDEALELMTTVLERAEGVNDPFVLAMCLAPKAVSLLGLGQYDLAIPLLEQHVDFTERHQVPIQSLPSRLNLVLSLLYRGRLAEARPLIERTVKLVEAGPHPRWPAVMALHARILTYNGEHEHAADVISRTLAQAETLHMPLPQQVELWLARLNNAFTRNDQPTVRHAEHRVETLLIELPLARFVHLAHLHVDWHAYQAKKAFLQWRSGTTALTAQQTEQFKVSFTKALTPHQHAVPNLQARLFLAELERLTTGTVSKATLTPITDTLAKLGGAFILSIFRDDLPDLFDMAQRRGWWRLESSLEQSERDQRPHHRLELSTLGQMSVSLDGHPVRFPFARCGELLVYLAFHGPVRKAFMLDALWDGTAGAATADYLRVMLRQLRLSLTHAADLPFNPVLYDQGHYRLHPTMHIDADLLKLRAAHKEVMAGNPPPNLPATAGEFLPEVEREWATTIRTEARDLQVSFHLKRGSLLEDLDPQEALDAYQSALKIDPFAGLAYDGLLRVYSALNDEAGIADVQRLRKRLIT